MQSLGHGFSYQKKIFEQCGRRRNRSSRSQWLIPHRRLTLNPNQSKKRFTWLKRITLTHWFFLIPQWSLLRILHIGIPNGYQNLSWRCTRSVKLGDNPSGVKPQWDLLNSSFLVGDSYTKPENR